MTDQPKRNLVEERWRGLGVSEGYVVGRVLRVDNGNRQVYRAALNEVETERELQRFQNALNGARRQLLDIKLKAEKELGPEHAYLFDAHLLMLEDRNLRERVETYIVAEKANAEWALRVVTDDLLAAYSAVKDEYLRARGSDIEDVAQRILSALTGTIPQYANLTRDAVIVSADLSPSAVAELDLQHARAITTDAGGWTSHTAIIARALGIPAVVGLRDLYRRTRTGDTIIVNSYAGEIVLHPTSATLESYGKEFAPERKPSGVSFTERETGPLRTVEGVAVTLRANVELPAEFASVRQFRASGIGLYRSEFLLSQEGVLLSEDEQYRAYLEVGRVAGADGATIRLFDLGGEQLHGGFGGERNPALGLRAIRFGLRHEDVLRTQVRAILRAAAQGRLDIVLPMVSDLADVRRARVIIEQERERLGAEGKETGVVKVGAMIEVPSAVILARTIAAEVDFFSLGTNDLVQYMLAVDRGNDDVSDWFRSLHPAVLRSVVDVHDAAAAASIRTVVCGEMASTPAYAVVLIGLGATEFSMTPSAIPRVARVVGAVKHSDARKIAELCLACATPDQVEQTVREQFLEHWPQLFSLESLPAAKPR
ncbi:MAG: phosphoenolpyruvate-protein phosphotransferase system enzyme [Blastocatellia bacterium]|nr:phosphoenolpyruvate-protein phosphotransferase system enzyme [Blastocatellia bacterium]